MSYRLKKYTHWNKYNADQFRYSMLIKEEIHEINFKKFKKINGGKNIIN